jgi:predicted SAM-dependent methyltransferase
MGFAAPRLVGRDKLIHLLSGSGIEIGALHRPVEAPHLKVKHVDRMSREDLLKQYPELQGLPIVQADVLDDAETLANIPDKSQDFVIANHVIEHMRNPIMALLNWQRVLKPGGRLFLAAPDKRYTFDKEREITPIEHILSDYNDPSRERDYQAFLDFARFVSCRTFNVKPESEYEQFAKHLHDIDYSIHFHVWDDNAFSKFVRYLEKNIAGWNLKVLEHLPTIGEEFLYVFERTK